MAVRITSNAQAYTRTISLGSRTAWSVTCWAKISTDTNAPTTLWAIDNGTGDYVGIRSDATGTLMRVISDFGAHGSRELAVGTWYFVAYSLGPSGGRLVTCESDGEFTTTTNGTPLTTNAANLRIGEWATNGDVLNGCVAGFKFWTATLSQAELEAEAFQYLPARTADLRAWYPFLSAGTTDFSGNAQTLSGGTGATTEDGPPIRWGGGRRRIIVPNTGGAVLGEAAAVLPALTAETSAGVVVSGQQSASLPSLAAALTAAAVVEGQADTALPPLAASMAAEAGAPGLLTAHLPALTGQFDGLLTGGILAAQLPALTSTVQGDLTAHGTAPAVLPSLTGSLAGEVEIPHNNLDLSVGPPYRGWTSRPLAPAWTAAAPARGWTARQPTT